MITARGGETIFDDRSVKGLLPGIKAKACACGADAIIITNSEEGGINWVASPDRARAQVTAIRYVGSKE